MAGKTRRQWKRVESQDSQGKIDLRATIADRDNCIGYAYAEIELEKPVDAVLLLGVDDSEKIWVNGNKVFEQFTARPLQVDQDRVPVHLKAGTNTILLKLYQNTQGWEFCVRIVTCRWPASAVQAKERITHRVWRLCKMRDRRTEPPSPGTPPSQRLPAASSAETRELAVRQSAGWRFGNRRSQADPGQPRKGQVETPTPASVIVIGGIEQEKGGQKVATATRRDGAVPIEPGKPESRSSPVLSQSIAPMPRTHRASKAGT